MIYTIINLNIGQGINNKLNTAVQTYLGCYFTMDPAFLIYSITSKTNCETSSCGLTKPLPVHVACSPRTYCVLECVLKTEFSSC